MFKKIASNTLAQLVAKFIGAGTTLLVTVLIIRLAGPSLFGDLTKSLSLIAIGCAGIDFGLNAVVVRSLGRAKNQPHLISDLIGARLVLSFFAIAILNLVVSILPGGYNDVIKSVFWVGSLAILFQGFITSMNSWFQYQENYWSSAASAIVGSLVSAGLTYYYVYHSPTLVHFLFSNTLGYLTTAITAYLLGRQIITPTFNPKRIYGLAKSSLLLGGILLASILASKLDSVILGVFRSSAEVGEYGFAYRIFDVILVLPVFIMNAIYPKLVKGSKESTRQLVQGSLWVLGGLGLLVASSVWVFAPWILYIKPGLTLSVDSLRLLVISLPLFFLTAPLMWFLISKNHEKFVFKTYLAATLVNAALNLIWIPHYGAPAAALTTGITELFILICLVYTARA